MIALKPVSRWTVARKLDVLKAIDSGLITLQEASAAYGASADEIAEWRTNFAAHGRDGLMPTHRRRAGRRVRSGKLR
jgi:Protein of unknown function (DUF1153)